MRGRQNKYGAAKVTYLGHTFDSRAEQVRFVLLSQRLEQGIISDLNIHPKFIFYLMGHKGPAIRPHKNKAEALDSFFERIEHDLEMIRFGHYTADFSYNDAAGDLVVEDVKSPSTAMTTDYRMRRKLMMVNYGIEIQEIMRK